MERLASTTSKGDPDVCVLAETRFGAGAFAAHCVATSREAFTTSLEALSQAESQLAGNARTIAIGSFDRDGTFNVQAALEEP
jgi:hypothetical protein